MGFGTGAQARRSRPNGIWRKVIQTTLPEEGPIDILELVLAHYYLGDAEGVGLGSVLDLLRQRESDTWLLFYLAGLGWAVRGDQVAARSNLQLAVMRRKSRAEGKVLDHSWWPFVVDLVEPAKQQTLVEFFENAQIQRRT